jgi:uncharacterized protein YoxC
MSFALQAALVLASVAFVALVTCVLPVAFAMRRRMETLAESTEHIKTDMQVLVREGRELIGNLNDLAKRIEAPMGDLSRVARSVRTWTDQLKEPSASARTDGKDMDHTKTPQVSMVMPSPATKGSREIQSSL